MTGKVTIKQRYLALIQQNPGVYTQASAARELACSVSYICSLTNNYVRRYLKTDNDDYIKRLLNQPIVRAERPPPITYCCPHCSGKLYWDEDIYTNSYDCKRLNCGRICDTKSTVMV